jgi:hypothetical protein
MSEQAQRIAHGIDPLPPFRGWFVRSIRWIAVWRPAGRVLKSLNRSLASALEVDIYLNGRYQTPGNRADFYPSDEPYLPQSFFPEETSRDAP